MAATPISSAWRVYFIVSSKDGHASLSVEHPYAGQELWLPVYPQEAVTLALPLLEPYFAHYASFWRWIMVSDPEDTDARGFFVEAKDLPMPITDAANELLLTEIARSAVPIEISRYWGKYLKGLHIYEPQQTSENNNDEFCVPASELGIPGTDGVWPDA